MFLRGPPLREALNVHEYVERMRHALILFHASHRANLILPSEEFTSQDMCSFTLDFCRLSRGHMPRSQPEGYILYSIFNNIYIYIERDIHTLYYMLYTMLYTILCIDIISMCQVSALFFVGAGFFITRIWLFTAPRT